MLIQAGLSVTKDIDQLEIVQTLLQMGDLKHLGTVALLDLAKSSHLQELNKGTLLSVDEYRQQHIYLVAGEVELSADSKDMQHIVAGTQRASLPLFRVHTHGLLVKCLTPVRMLLIDEDIVKRYVATIRPKDTGGIQVEEYSDTEQEASILGEIRHVFFHNEVDLPSLPEFAVRINRAVNDPNRNLHDLSMEIQADPMIAARVIQVANSALYHPAQPLNSIQSAVSRVGVKTLQAITMRVVLHGLFKPKSALIHKRAAQFYTHSIRVGAICFILARHLSVFNEEHAFLAGLLHDVGVMPILIQADERTDLSTNQALLEMVIHDLSGIVGVLLLRQWGFSEDLQIVAKEAQKWHRQIDVADYCDLVQVAQLHCHLVGGHKLDAPPLNDLPAFGRLHLERLDPVSIVHEARDEIHDIVNILTH